MAQIPITDGEKPDSLDKTWKFLSLLAIIFTILGMAIASGGYAYHSSELIRNSVQHKEFMDSVHSLEYADTKAATERSTQNLEINNLQRRILGLLCEQPRNKASDFCSPNYGKP